MYFYEENNEIQKLMTTAEITDLILQDSQKRAASRNNTLGVPGFQTNMKRLGVSSPQIKEIVTEWSKILFNFCQQQ